MYKILENFLLATLVKLLHHQKLHNVNIILDKHAKINFVNLIDCKNTFCKGECMDV